MEVKPINKKTRGGDRKWADDHWEKRKQVDTEKGHGEDRADGEQGSADGKKKKRRQEDGGNPERICQLSLALILMEASALPPLTHLALIPALLSKLFKL